MINYIISTCSVADITKEHFEKIDVKYICFHYELNNVSYKDDLGESIPFEEFYRRMDEGEDTKTSQINAEEYCDYFRQFLDEGYDILHITLSSGISGTYNSANIAKEMLQEEYPNRKIYVVDSLAASAGLGLLVDEVASKRDEGMCLEDLYQWILDNRLRVNHWFFSTDLKFFIKGGRVSKTAGTIGNMLNICPLLNVSNEGKLIPRFKIRGKKNVIKFTANKMLELVENGADYNGKCYISQSACVEDAKALASQIEELIPNLKGKIEITYIGNLIGSHTGPGTVALFFWGKERAD
ncbi:MAG: DegV family protein [Lachnospiraceae bacterium]|nr:DegV family protein [Lachnospiraceae bacterium]